MSTRAKGIDVSHWRPLEDATAVLDAGMSFIGAKVTEGNLGVDPLARTHIAAIRAQPFVLAIWYHFAMPGDPQKQAQHTLDIVGSMRGNERIALDVEGGGAPHVDWISAYMAEIAREYPARRHLVYTSKRIWRTGLGDPAWAGASAYDLWLPRYSTTAEPEIPKPWHKWTFWQFSEAYQCDGVGSCDASFFNGDLSALKAYAAGQPAALVA